MSLNVFFNLLCVRLCLQTDPPEFNNTATQYDRVKGTSVTLACDVSANPAATQVVWYKNGAVLNVQSSSFYTGGTVSTPDLTISALHKTDSDVYVCSVTNALGTRNSTNINLNVQCEYIYINIVL
jgi:hypothetical protein